MKLPIPDDFKGEWQCIEIYWPKSQGWMGLLAGAITQFGRRYIYDEATGDEVRAQEIGREITSRNIPFMDCTGQRIIIEPSYEQSGGLIVIGEDDMGQVVTNVYIEDNELVVEFGPCCIKRFAVADYDGTSSGGGATGGWELPDDIDNDLTPFYPCGMAAKVAGLLAAFAGHVWDNADNLQGILMVHSAQSALGIDLNNIWTMEATAQALIMKGAVVISAGALDLEKSDVVPSWLADELTCALLPLMTDREPDGAQIKSAINAFIEAKFPQLTSPNNIFIINYYQYLANAVGSGNLADIAKSGMLDGTAECNCTGGEYTPEQETPAVNGWYFGEENLAQFSAPGGFNDYTVPINEPLTHDIYGVAWRVEVISGDPLLRHKPGLEITALTHDVYMFGVNSLEHSEDIWYMSVGNTAFASVQDLLPDASQVTIFGTVSDTPASPVAEAGEVAQAPISLRANGDDTAKCYGIVYWRWLHNTGSPSHD